MKLDPTVLRTMKKEDFRVLDAIEKGMKDHAIVPLKLIVATANLRHGGAHKIISSLLRDKLLSHERRKSSYDGYRITNAGYDIMALHNLKSRGFVAAIGQKIGTGKESDIYLAVNPNGKQIVLKFHRLGRTSFRNVKKKRDYFGKATQQAHSWLFLSKLSALKEFAFMQALHNVQYPTPTPLAHNRHVVAMSLVRGVPLYQVFPKQLSAEQSADIYEQAIGLAARLAKHGLVHCDLNEFNLLVDLSGIQAIATAEDDPYVRHSGQSVVSKDKSIGALSKPAWEQSLEEGDRVEEALPDPVEFLENGDPKPVVTLIDFPQMISTLHPNAQELYERDLACLRRFFEHKMQCVIPDDVDTDVAWEMVVAATNSDHHQVDVSTRLDEDLRASGSTDTTSRDLELYYFQSGPSQITSAIEEIPEEDDEEEEEYSDEDVKDTSDIDDVEVEVVHNVPEVDEDSAVQKPFAQGDDASVFDSSIYSTSTALLSREEIEERARRKVRRQLDEQKRKNRSRGAFRKGNSNKSYLKGKRVMAESMF